jgi:hypothetical protein
MKPRSISMKTRWTRIVLLLVAYVVVIGVKSWFYFRERPADPQTQGYVAMKVRHDPRLWRLYEESRADGVLTSGEAKAILDKSKE